MECGHCSDACPQKVQDKACMLCGKCVSACPTGALCFDAKTITVAEALVEVEKDRVFYETSGGGVTLSGGECTASPEFALELLNACRARGIDTAIETCLHTPPEIMRLFCLATDRIIADIKLADPEEHETATGVDNKLIVENLRMLAKADCNLLIRIPLIPGFTATEKNIRGIGSLIAGLPRRIPVELINFNPMCREKYEILGSIYQVEQAIPLDTEQINRYKQLLTDYSLQVL